MHATLPVLAGAITRNLAAGRELLVARRREAEQRCLSLSALEVSAMRYGDWRRPCWKRVEGGDKSKNERA